MNFCPDITPGVGRDLAQLVEVEKSKTLKRQNLAELILSRKRKFKRVQPELDFMGYEGNTAENTGDKSIKLTPDDQDNIDKAGYPLDKSVSTLFSELAEDAELLARLKDEKKEEIRRIREKARDMESKWDL